MELFVRLNLGRSEVCNFVSLFLLISLISSEVNQLLNDGTKGVSGKYFGHQYSASREVWFFLHY